MRRTAYPSVTLIVAPQWDSATLGCEYRFTPAADRPVRQDRFSLVFEPVGNEARFKHQNSGQVFGDVHALSEYLLTPVFTGRPRVG